LKHAKRNARILAALLVLVGCLAFAGPALAQEQGDVQVPEDAPAALSAALSAACRQDEAGFSKYLTKDNAAAFQGLPTDQRKAVLRRFSLSDDPGKPLRTDDLKGRGVLRCENSAATSEFHLGKARVDENLAFVPVEIAGGTIADFGLVRQSGSWKLISVGLVVFDINQLASRWAQQELDDRESAALQILQELSTAVESYRRAFGTLPNSLAELGPAPKNEVSPEQANLISADMAVGAVGGYKYRYLVVNQRDPDSPSYQLSAIPSTYGQTGKRSFLLDPMGKLHAIDKHGEPANSDDPIIPTGPATTFDGASSAPPANPSSAASAKPQD
jgi:hypothetical protein